MKISQWSTNSKLPWKNIPLPSKRDPDLFAYMAGRGWVAPIGGQGGDGQGHAGGKNGQVLVTGLRCRTVSALKQSLFFLFFCDSKQLKKKVCILADPTPLCAPPDRGISAFSLIKHAGYMKIQIRFGTRFYD